VAVKLETFRRLIGCYESVDRAADTRQKRGSKVALKAESRELSARKRLLRANPQVLAPAAATDSVSKRLPAATVINRAA